MLIVQRIEGVLTGLLSTQLWKEIDNHYFRYLCVALL